MGVELSVGKGQRKMLGSYKKQAKGDVMSMSKEDCCVALNEFTAAFNC